jgi:hypothetical protein
MARLSRLSRTSLFAPHDEGVGLKHTQIRRRKMKKLIFTSMLTAVGLLAQNSGTAPAAQPKPSTAAPAAQSQTSQSQTKAQHHKKKKAKTNGTAAAAPASGGATTTPAPAKK